jgi:hypothetical protein
MLADLECSQWLGVNAELLNIHVAYLRPVQPTLWLLVCFLSAARIATV